MLSRTRSNVKPTPVQTTRVLFDGGRKTNPADMATFGRGVEAERQGARWNGAYGGTMPCTASDDIWAALLCRKTAEELDAEMDAYNAMLDQREYEAACLDRYTRGFAG